MRCPAIKGQHANKRCAIPDVMSVMWMGGLQFSSWNLEKQSCHAGGQLFVNRTIKTLQSDLIGWILLFIYWSYHNQKEWIETPNTTGCTPPPLRNLCLERQQQLGHLDNQFLANSYFKTLSAPFTQCSNVTFPNRTLLFAIEQFK